MPVLRTAVLEIAYADHGDEAAPALVVVHGWPDAARVDACGRCAGGGQYDDLRVRLDAIDHLTGADAGDPGRRRLM